jgi:hypothetical protein
VATRPKMDPAIVGVATTVTLNGDTIEDVTI